MSRIAAIETFAVTGQGDQGAYGAPYGLFVKVESDDGIIGWGETDSMPGVVEAVIAAPAVNEVMSGLAAVLIGCEADPEAAWRAMLRATLCYGRDGPPRHAMAAIDIALWDILGKRQRKPVSVLLGGTRRQRVRAYATAPLGRSLEETDANARRLVDKGFTAMKFGWAPLGADADADEAIVKTLRKAIGPERDLLIDAGMAWNVETAIARTHLFAPYRLYWLEEPLEAYDVAGYARLAAAIETPVAAGEMASTYAELAGLIEAGGVDIVQVDISRTGLTEAMRVAALAGRHGVRCVNHTYSYLLNAAASLHFMAAVDSISLYEYQGTPNEIRDALELGQLRPDDGWVAVPTGPGLGVEVDETALRRFRSGAHRP